MAVEAVDEPTASGTEESAKAATGRVQLAPAQPWCGEYALASARFMAGVVGAKSLNSQALQVRRQARMRGVVAFGVFIRGKSGRESACGPVCDTTHCDCNKARTELPAWWWPSWEITVTKFRTGLSCVQT